MSVTINGTSGVTTPGINNSEGYTGDGLSIAAGAPAGALQIDTSGNAGLGVVPSAWGEKALQVGPNAGISSSSAISSFSSNTYWTGSYSGQTYINNGYANAYLNISGEHRWYTAPSGTAGNPITFTQAMTLDVSGNLMVGTNTFVSPAARFNVLGAVGTNNVCGFQTSGAFGNYIFQNSSGTQVGYIQTNSTTTTYATTSDYRLKENVAPLTNALDTIAALKPCTFTWKTDGSADRGFIAHELQEVIPQAVSGEKDAVDDEGNIKPQGVDYGKITPELVAAIQELKARIEQLEAK